MSSTVSDMRLGLIAGSLLSISILATTSGSALGAPSTFGKAVFARGFDHPICSRTRPESRTPCTSWRSLDG